LLIELQQRLGMSLLLISHDLNLVRRIAQRVCVMRHGEIVEQADCEALFRAPQHPYSRLLIEAEPSGGPVPSEYDHNLLEVDDLKVWFPLPKALFSRQQDYIKAVDGVSFTLQRGKTLGIVGESGSGKSTLGQAILRLVESEGNIRFGNKQLSLLNQRLMRPLRRQIQVVFQDPFGSLSPRMSVQQIIAEGLLTHGIGTEAEREAAVIRVLEEVGLDPQSRHRYPHEFSGGQRQRISIARALVLEPALILLDEPTSALDRTVQKQVVELLRQLQIRHGLTYLFISHDLAVVHALAHDLMVIKDGKVVEQGSSREIFAAPKHPYTQELLNASGLKPDTKPCGSWLASDGAGSVDIPFADPPLSLASQLPQV
jgi:microcin C transport system ATP-binding protein